MVKVPPFISSIVSAPSLARLPRSPMAFSMSAKPICVDIADDRDDQAIGRGDRDRQVDIVVIDDLIALDLRVDGREVLEREASGLGEEAHEAQLHAMLLFESCPCSVSRASITADHVASLKVVSSAAVSCASLQPLGDGLAQAGHLDAFFAAFAAGGGAGAAEAVTVAAAGAPPLARGEHIFLGQSAILAATLDLARIDAMFEDKPAHGGRQRQVSRGTR